MRTRLLVALLALAPLMLAAPPPSPTAPRPSGSSGAVPPVPGTVVRSFDPPAHPYGPGHRGVGLEAAPGAPVVAALAGTVTFAGAVADVGWVTVAHGQGLDTTYGPLDPRAVTAGQRVERGQRLGRLADAATHLHWGARLHGVYLDPLLLFERWQVHLVDVTGLAG